MAEADRVEIIVDQDSLRHTQELLRLFAPKLLAQLRQQIAAEGKVVTEAAGARLAALQQTHGTYYGQPDNAAQRYVVRQTRNLVQLRNPARGAAITEFAGKKNPGGRTPRGASLIRTLEERYGKPGRILWQAFDEAAPAMLANVARLVAAAEAEVNAQMNADSAIAAMPFGGM